MAEIDDSPSSTVSESTRKFSFLRAVAIAALMGFVGCFGWLTYVAHFGLEATTQRTRQLLDSKTFDRFELRDATFPEAVETFRRALSEAGIDEKKVRTRVMDSAAPTNKNLAEQKASIVLTNIPPYEAGYYLAGLFDLEASIHGKEFRIHAKEDKPLIHRTIRINPNFPVARGLPLNSDGSYDFRGFLTSQGISFPEGSWAKSKPGSEELEVYLPQIDIDLINSLGGCYGGPSNWRERILEWFGLWP